MATRRIGAKEAVADIRAGMKDSTLMIKYRLSPEGLQGLFDKLVTAGFIDLGEIQSRMPGFLGTVAIFDPISQQEKAESPERVQAPKGKSAPINAQEAARDVRSGVDDAALMEKYRLSSRGLRSLFDKLVAVGVITRADLDRRRLGIDTTVDLKEDMLSLSAALRQWGYGKSEQSTNGTRPHADQPEAPSPVEANRPRPAVLHEKKPETTGETAVPQAPEPPWYDLTGSVVLLLIGLFPLGLYALYRNSALAREAKGLVLLCWAVLAALFILVVGKIL